MSGVSERIRTHGLVRTKLWANYIIKVVRDNQTLKNVVLVRTKFSSPDKVKKRSYTTGKYQQILLKQESLLTLSDGVNFPWERKYSSLKIWILEKKPYT